eukprot:scaffold301_cov243-Pinguiococcus_pyrenoidosus.AAC.116
MAHRCAALHSAAQRLLAAPRFASALGEAAKARWTIQILQMRRWEKNGAQVHFKSRSLAFFFQTSRGESRPFQNEKAASGL